MPPKKVDSEPQPEIVDTVKYEEGDIADVREQAFPASADFFDRAFSPQFGDDETAWVDEDDEDDHGEPECRTQ